MGNSEEDKSTKVEKPSSPVTTDPANQINPTNVHLYPDWVAMQAYYGPRVTMPPYYNSAMAPAHAPHPYMWPPQPMMPPYGAPYAAIYSHGGVYPHPAVPMGPQSHGQGIQSPPAGGTPLSMDTPTKSSGNTDQGLMKKLKEFDGLAMSIGNGYGNSNGNANSAERGVENRLSQSEDTEGSSDGSDGNTAGANQTRRKRSREGTPTTGGDGKAEIQATLLSKETSASNKTMTVVPASVAGKMAGPVVSSVIPPEAWLQNERELKRERRKQSNRESARRSRLRKQAETEELARKVESLNAENVTLKSEINRLTDNSEKLRAENAALMVTYFSKILLTSLSHIQVVCDTKNSIGFDIQEKLKNAQQGQTEEIVLNGIDGKRATPISTENLLARVNNSGSNDRTTEEDNGYRDDKQNSSAKLHQLLDTSPRADAVAAG